MENHLKRWLVTQLPFLLRIKAVARAVWYALSPIRPTYSQHGEDALILSLCDGKLPDGPYVDVGANHPSYLSNTYLFYRMGKTGVVIDPAVKQLSLHRLTRPRDTAIALACGDHPGCLPFRHAVADVLSGFETTRSKMGGVVSIEWVPVLPIDDVLIHLVPENIFLWSIDVEGYDKEVLRGGAKTLARTRFIIIEGARDDQEIIAILDSAGFRLRAHTPDNLIWENTTLAGSSLGP